MAGFAIAGRSTNAFAGRTTGLAAARAGGRGATLFCLLVAAFGATAAGGFATGGVAFGAGSCFGDFAGPSGTTAAGDLAIEDLPVETDFLAADFAAGVAFFTATRGLGAGTVALTTGFAAALVAGLASGLAVVLTAGRVVAFALFAGDFSAGRVAGLPGAGLTAFPVATFGADAGFAGAGFFASGLGAAFLADLTGVDFFLAGDFMGLRCRSDATRRGVEPHGEQRRRRNPAHQWFY